MCVNILLKFKTGVWNKHVRFTQYKQEGVYHQGETGVLDNMVEFVRKTNQNVEEENSTKNLFQVVPD